MRAAVWGLGGLALGLVLGRWTRRSESASPHRTGYEGPNKFGKYPYESDLARFDSEGLTTANAPFMVKLLRRMIQAEDPRTHYVLARLRLVLSDPSHGPQADPTAAKYVLDAIDVYFASHPQSAYLQQPPEHMTGWEWPRIDVPVGPRLVYNTPTDPRSLIEAPPNIAYDALETYVWPRAKRLDRWLSSNGR